MERKEYIHEDKFSFEDGGEIENLRITYHISENYRTNHEGREFETSYEKTGSDNQCKDIRPTGERLKVVWICHALTANSDPTDWWPEFAGPGKVIDTDKFLVVCVNMLGSAYGSSGPSSEDPATGRPYFFDFPKVSVRDIVNANILVRKHLGIEKIDVLIGGSIGGFQALEWSVMEPQVIGKAVYIATNARATPWLTAYNESQRMALEADPTFRQCESLKGGEAGLRAARSIALISYRSYEGYGLTQAEPDEDTMWASKAASYQRYQGKKLSDRFDAYSYYYLAGSVDSHNLGRRRGGVEAALASIKAECTVIGIDSDRLFPVEEQKFLASNIRGAVYHEITSAFGHDGFLLEYDQLADIIQPLL